MTTSEDTLQEPVDINASVQTLDGIGEKRAAALAALGIYSIRDFILHLPRDYRDRSVINPISSVKIGDTVTIQGEIVSARSLRLRGRKTMALLTVHDTTGDIKVSFFGRGFLAHTTLKKGIRCLFTGKVKEYKGLTLQNPEYEPVEEEENDTIHSGRIVPVYPLTDGITQRQLRQWIYRLIQLYAPLLEDTIPEYLRQIHDFTDIASALLAVHFPRTLSEAMEARKRFAYEELLAMQVGILQNRKNPADSPQTGAAHQ